MLPVQCTLVFPKRGGKVYLARHKRGPFIGKLSGYGGHIEDSIDLSPHHNACREVYEESKVMTSTDHLQYLGRVHFYHLVKRIECFVYILWEWEGEFQETDEMEKAEAYAQDELPFDQMTEGDSKWLPRFLAGDTTTPYVYHNEDWTLDRVEYPDAA